MKNALLKIKFYAIVVLGLNLATILLGLLYLILSSDSAFWDVSGWLFLGSWTITLPLVLMVSQVVDPHGTQGKRINHLSYLTLVVMVLATLIMFGVSLILSATVYHELSEITGIFALLYGLFFGVSGMNCIFAFGMVNQTKMEINAASTHGEVTQDVTDVAKPVSTKTSHTRKFTIMHIIGLITCAGALLWMFYFAMLALNGFKMGISYVPNIGGLNGVIGLLAGTFGWLFSIFAWGAGTGSMKLLRGLHRDRIGAVFGIIGVIIGSILLAPMIAVPSLQTDVEARFGQAFGSDWNTRIASSRLSHMKGRPLVTAEYFLPHPLWDCIVKEDISFYNGTVGVDNGITLYFDAYLPAVYLKSLPGANSTLIRIHGGGWTIGDKGTGNYPLMNRYFAAQGYCVFDIQYGISNQSSFLDFGKVITPEYLMGNFSIDDMARHIGLFCQYLTEHQTEYNANLSSVFVSGGSAGGHLTCLTALAIASGNYTSIFGSGMTIKGYIPFYPANGVAQFIDGGVSKKEFYDPTLLVTKASPPCLIYQGEQDGLVDPQTSQDLKDTYIEQQNPACMIIYLPFAGHGSDMDFYSYYNQFFLYYMERFMYLYR